MAEKPGYSLDYEQHTLFSFFSTTFEMGGPHELFLLQEEDLIWPSGSTS